MENDYKLATFLAEAFFQLTDLINSFYPFPNQSLRLIVNAPAIINCSLCVQSSLLVGKASAAAANVKEP